MTIKISKKITGFSVAKPDAATVEETQQALEASPESNVIQMHEKVEHACEWPRGAF